MFASPAAPTVTTLVVTALWAGALLLGRERGPALRPPFPTHALAAAEPPRAITFGGPFVRAGALVTLVTTAAAGLIAGSLVNRGLIDPFEGGRLIAVGVLVGVMTSVGWLAGQASPRAAVPLALGMLALGAIAVLVPLAQPVIPSGWVGLAYPVTGSAHRQAASGALTALTALTAALAALAPVLLNRLSVAELSMQSARWASWTAHASGMEFGAAATVYRRRPHLGRRVRAVRGVGPLPLRFLLRDAVGAARTPGRLLAGVLAVASAGALVSLAFAPAAPSWLLGVAAGLLLFAGLGPLTDGVRHAASVASDLPLYGIGDERLLAAHLMFPIAAVALILLVAVIAGSIVGGVGAAGPIASALAGGLLVVLARVADALKGPLPAGLLMPVPTPMGDLGAVARSAWAVDGMLLAAAAGASAVLLFRSPVPFVVVAVTVTGLGLNRWFRRR